MYKHTASRRLTAIFIAVFLSSLLPASAAAQTPIGNANFLEWDIPVSVNSAAGALEVVSTGGTTRDVFYVTRQTTPAPRLIRLVNPPTTVAPTSWQSWALYGDSLSANSTGGLKMRPGEGGTGQLVFVRDSQFIHRVTTNSIVNNHTRWMDTGFGSTSDLALDVLPVGGTANIYTTSGTATTGTLQQLNGGSSLARRWNVGGGAGSIYLSGVAVRRASTTQVRVYWSEPTLNRIGELNPGVTTNNVRRWALPAGVTQPRQLDLDAAGNVWVVTGSGHVVRLTPSTGDITPYFIPTPGSSPFGVGPDGLIGFTENATKKVGMLIPDGTVSNVAPITVTVPSTTTTLGSTTVSKVPSGGMVTPVVGMGPATSTGTAATGIFVEATLPGLSAAPNAIEDDTNQPTPPSGAFGRNFFYSVSTPSTNRIGWVELVRPAPVPTTLTLSPKTFTNPVDTQHCVTATVEDQYGEPMENVNVEFRVTGSVTASGDEDTDSDGEAEFCYTGPAFPGGDAIHAWADWNTDNGMQDLLAIPPEPFDDATKAWVFPVSTPGCEVKITNGGWIIAANTDRASFGGNAKVDGDGNVSGNEEYQDHGPFQPMNAHGNVLVVTCSPNQTQATIFGEATVDGAGSYLYRIDVQDLGEPGKGVDTYRFRLEPPSTYDSGEQILQGGNVQIHQSN